MTASLSDARDALINAAIDSLASYRSSVLTVPQPGLLAPACLRLLPLYILALLKHVRHTLHTRSTSWPCSNTYDTRYTLALHPGPAQTRTTYSHTRSTSWPCSNTYDTRYTLALHPGPAQTRTTHATYSHTRSTSWPCSNTYDILTHSLYILAPLKHVRHTLHTHTPALHPGPAQTRTTHATHSHTRSTSWPCSNTYDTHYILTHSLYILALLKHVRHTLHTRSTSWPCSNTYDTRYTLALHPGPAQTRTTQATYSHTRSTSWPCSNTYDILTHSLYILAPLKHVRHTLHTHTPALHPGPAQTRTTHTTYSHTRSTSWPCSNTYDTHYILTHSLYILTPLKHV